MSDSTYRICFVCTGNICRSPMGEVVLREALDAAGLGDVTQVDSAGTGDWHIGHPADPRTVDALAQGGYDGSAHRARQFEAQWLAERDLVVVADRGHLEQVEAMVGPQSRATIALVRAFDPEFAGDDAPDLDDPYYGDRAGFDRCLAEVEAAVPGMVDHVQAALGRGRSD